MQYGLEANPGLETTAGKFQERNNLVAGKRCKRYVKAPRNLMLANRRRIWGMAGRVAREMKGVVGVWEARGQGAEGGEGEVDTEVR